MVVDFERRGSQRRKDVKLLAATTAIAAAVAGVVTRSFVDAMIAPVVVMGLWATAALVYGLINPRSAFGDY